MAKESTLKDFICGFKRMGRKNKDLLLKKLEDLELTDLEFIIMKSRYVDGLGFKQVWPAAGVCERRMYYLHNSAMQKAVAQSHWEYLRC